MPEINARQLTLGDNTFTVWCEGRTYDKYLEVYRPVYSYSIVTPKWRYDANDIQGAANEIPNLSLASAALLAMLLTCVQAGENDLNSDLFPEHVRELGQELEDQLIEVCASMTGED